MAAKTAEQKEKERKAKLEKMKADIEAGILTDMSKVNKKDREDLIKMGVNFEAPKDAGEEDQDSEAESDKEDDQSEDKEDQEASKEKDIPVKPAKVEPKASAHKGSFPHKVLSLVNMVNNDGNSMEAGKLCSISDAEYKRLKADARGPFFEE